jgi:hypothetical protein
VPSPTYPPASADAAPKPDPPKIEPKVVPADDPDSDRRPPELLFLRFDPPEIQDGGTATLSVGTADNLSGVKSVVGTMRTPSDVVAMPFIAQDPDGDGVFTAGILVPRHAESGDWFVGTLQLVDKVDNPASYSFARTTVPPGGALRVISTESDSAAPIVHRVVVDKTTVSGGERNQIEVDVDDDRSGVGFVTGTFKSPSKSASILFACVPKGEDVWIGDVAVPANADCGLWSLTELRVTDKASNTAVLNADSPELAHASFNVAGSGGCDPDPPVLDSLEVAPTVVSNANATEVVLTVTAHDDGSGLVSLNGRFEGPLPTNGEVPKSFFFGQPDPKNIEAPIVVKIRVPQFSPTGIWRVRVLRLTDKAGNTRDYEGTDPALANAYFRVESGP